MITVFIIIAAIGLILEILKLAGADLIESVFWRIVNPKKWEKQQKLEREDD